jgi:hypothetical protein
MHATPRVSRTTIIRKVSTRLKPVLCSWDEVLPSSYTWLSRHPGLPHSPSNKSPQSRGCCDRTTSEMRGLSPKIISGDSRRSENAQTHTNKHTIPNMKFKLKLLQIKCRALGFTKVKAPKCALKELIRVLRKRLSLTIGTRSSP